MKATIAKSLLIVSFCFINGFIFGQEVIPDRVPKKAEPIKPQEPPVIYEVVDEPAEFPGGTEALKKFIADNLKYPEIAKEKAIQGKCYLQFIVSETGQVSNIKVKKGVTDCKECDVEAIRVVKLMPKWKPGQTKGKNVNSTFTLPISFKL